MATPMTRDEVADQLKVIWIITSLGISKEQAAMFSRVVYKLADDKYKVEGTDEIGNKTKTTYYKHLDDLPDGLRDKVKQLMWTDSSDQSITDDLGVRIGENIFWII